MSSVERASIFGDDEDLSAAFKPKAAPPAPAIPRETIRTVSEAANFRSRDPKPASADTARREQRRHRTGRNVQLNIKARAEAVEAFYALADQENWVLGETFERAIEALRDQLARSRQAKS
ncbi:MAG: hypothetical protein AB7F35_16620 [Acetobacteraceae bacterium]